MRHAELVPASHFIGMGFHIKCGMTNDKYLIKVLKATNPIIQLSKIPIIE